MTKTKPHPNISRITDALKNRQNVELRGTSVAVRKLLDELITVDRGVPIIPPRHEEDYRIRVLDKIVFPASDKMSVENIQRQVLQAFGWPLILNLSHVQFFGGKLLKELHHDRVLPVFLFEYPELLKRKAFSLLPILSEYSVDRLPVGIPSIICITERGRPVGSLTSSSLVIELPHSLTRDEIVGIIDQTVAGSSQYFSTSVIKELEQLSSHAAIRTAIKNLLSTMNKLGLQSIDEELYHQCKLKTYRHGTKTLNRSRV